MMMVIAVLGMEEDAEDICAAAAEVSAGAVLVAVSVTRAIEREAEVGALSDGGLVSALSSLCWSGDC